MELDDILNIDIDPDLLLSYELEKLNLDDIPNDISDLLGETPEKDSNIATQSNSGDSERAITGSFDYFQACASRTSVVLDESGEINIKAASETSKSKEDIRKEGENDEEDGYLSPPTYFRSKNCDRTQSDFKRKRSWSDSSHDSSKWAATIQKSVPYVFDGIYFPVTSSTLGYCKYPKSRKAGSRRNKHNSSLQCIVESPPRLPVCSPNLDSNPESINEQDIWNFLIENAESESTNNGIAASGVGDKDDQGRIAEIMNFLKGMPDKDSSALIEKVRRLKRLKRSTCRRTDECGRSRFEFKRMILRSGSNLAPWNPSTTSSVAVQSTVPCETEFANDSSHRDFDDDATSQLISGIESEYKPSTPNAIGSPPPFFVFLPATSDFVPESVCEQDILVPGNTGSVSTSNDSSMPGVDDQGKTTEITDFLKNIPDKNSSKPTERGGHVSRSRCRRAETYKRPEFEFNRKRPWSGSCHSVLSRPTTPDVTVLNTSVSHGSKLAQISSKDTYEDVMTQSVSSPESGYDSSTPSITGSPYHLPVSSPLNLDFIPETVNEQPSLDPFN